MVAISNFVKVSSQGCPSAMHFGEHFHPKYRVSRGSTTRQLPMPISLATTSHSDMAIPGEHTWLYHLARPGSFAAFDSELERQPSACRSEMTILSSPALALDPPPMKRLPGENGPEDFWNAG